MLRLRYILNDGNECEVEVSASVYTIGSLDARRLVGVVAVEIIAYYPEG